MRIHVNLLVLTTLLSLPFTSQALAQDALSDAENALYVATQQRDIPGQLQAIQQIADHYRKVERPKRALSYYRLGLETDPSESGKALLLRQIAQVHLDMKELANAQLFAQESTRILRAQAHSKTGANALSELAASLITLATIRLESLDFFQAQEDLSESFRLSKSLMDESLLDQCHQTLVRLRQKQGNVDGTKTALVEWASTRKAREQREQLLAQAKNTTPLSLCEKNWKENNFAGALKATRSSPQPKTNAHVTQAMVALDFCKAKSQLKLNRHEELLADYAQLPKHHPLLNDPGMQLLVARGWMGLENHEKAAAVSKATLQMLNAQSTSPSSENAEIQFALTENLILIELQSAQPSPEHLLNLCKQAEQFSPNSNSPVWGDCALVHASAGLFEKALDYTQLADLWFAEFGTARQKIENRLIKALIQVELGQVEEGLISVSGATKLMESSETQEWPGFERQAFEIQALAAEKKQETERAANFYKLALNAANAEGNEIEMERLAKKLANQLSAANKAPKPKATDAQTSEAANTPKSGTFKQILTWFEQLRTPEYLRSLNPFKKKTD